MRPAAPPAQQTILPPEPVAQAPVSETLDTSVTPAQEEPAVLEDDSNPELPLTSVRDDSSPGDGSVFVRYLSRLTDAGRSIPFLREPSAGNGSVLAFGKLQAGYGRIFTHDSVITSGRNWTPREERSCFYLQTSFSF
jgi:hypothetical protein